MPKRGLLLVYVVVVVGGDGGAGDDEGVAVPVVASRCSSAVTDVVVEIVSVSPRVCVTESAPSLMLPELPLTYLVVALVSETRLARSRTHTQAIAHTRARARATHATKSRYPT